jgi:YVTN family beta-propeller protein
MHVASKLRLSFFQICVFLMGLFATSPACASTGPFAYVTNQCSGTVTVIDTANDAVLTSPIAVGNAPFGAVVNPAGTRVYVTNADSSTVSVIDIAANPPSAIATISVGPEPFGIAINPEGTRVYVGNNGAGTNDTVSVIDTGSNIVITTITVGFGPGGLAVNPAGTRLYVVNNPASTLSVIDTSSNSVITTVPLNGSNALSGVIVNPSGSRVYVAGPDAHLVHVLDSSSNTVISEISVPGKVEGIALTPDGTRLYAAISFNADTVAVIDTASNSLIATIPVQGDAASVAVTPDGARAYVTAAPNSVFAIDTTSNTIADTISVPCPSSFGSGFISPTTASPHTVALLDPVPSLLSGPAVTTNPTLLATGGRPVKGVAADGVTQIIVRIQAHRTAERFSLTVLNDQGGQSISPDEDGAVAAVGTTEFRTATTVSAVATAFGPMAFAIYRAPMDFPRHGKSDDEQIVRAITISVVSSDVPGDSFNASADIIRPPVILVHGLWADRSSWDFFDPLSCKNPTANCPDPRFHVFKFDYSKTSDFGFVVNANLFQNQLSQFINTFKFQSEVAAIEADIVAHSMGGDITRTLVILRQFLRNQNYMAGDIHKLITLDTPHLGSQFATRLIQSALECRVTFAKVTGHVVDGAVRDLELGSDILNVLQNTTRIPIRAHMIVGISSQEQALASEFQILTVALQAVCPNLLAGGYQGIFGQPNDLIVSEESQEAQGLSFDFPGLETPAAAKTIVALPVVHVVLPGLIPLGPDILSRDLALNRITYIGVNTGIPQLVITLLNTPIQESSFERIRP